MLHVGGYVLSAPVLYFVNPVFNFAFHIDAFEIFVTNTSTQMFCPVACYCDTSISKNHSCLLKVLLFDNQRAFGSIWVVSKISSSIKSHHSRRSSGDLGDHPLISSAKLIFLAFDLVSIRGRIEIAYIAIAVRRSNCS